MITLTTYLVLVCQSTKTRNCYLRNIGDIEVCVKQTSKIKGSSTWKEKWHCAVSMYNYNQRYRISKCKLNSLLIEIYITHCSDFLQSAVCLSHPPLQLQCSSIQTQQNNNYDRFEKMQLYLLSCHIFRVSSLSVNVKTAAASPLLSQ